MHTRLICLILANHYLITLLSRSPSHEKTTPRRVVYVETNASTTNANGLVSLEMGAGTVVIGTFVSINWANGPSFIQTETDPIGSTNCGITQVKCKLCLF